MNAQKLSAIAANVATKAANRRLVRIGWTPGEIAAAAEPLADAILHAIADAWPAAMADAQAALDARMTDAATMTLEASFALAGIAAADAHHAAAAAAADPDAITVGPCSPDEATLSLAGIVTA